MKRKRPSVPLTVLGAASALALGVNDVPAQTGTKAGVAAAVRGPVQQVSFRTPQSTVGRNVASGDEIFLGDRIVTGPAGGLQIMLLDGTTFSVGPNSSMVIDEFVYNPSTGTGKLTASVARGTLRLISGRLGRQDEEAIKIKLPVATVGVRGTMSIFSGGPNGWFTGLFGIGPNNSVDRPGSYLAVEINGVVYNIFRTGWGCTMTPADPACKPQPVGPEFLQQLLGAIAGQLRFVDLGEFERLTGLDLVTALGLLKSQQGFEDLWQKIDQLFQDRSRPGEFQQYSPPPPPPYSPPPSD
ncbi:MAG: FecR domain-containing protein [Alphaproteobacteria bacterium]